MRKPAARPNLIEGLCCRIPAAPATARAAGVLPFGIGGLDGRIGSAPSAALCVPGVGRARWSVELARQRNGPPFTMVLEGCDAQGRLALPADAADRAAAAGGAVARAA